ncbi:MAG TPA: DNA polymerase III subunit gamma/tau [Thermoanaerobaculia bacterium]|nr:DNA polymerase III subunit gamma/tau [Thermoanaerobaculia bacterium]
MTYQVLARKWRPQSFSSLVGQEPIVTALRNALREGRIAQAYLFSGIRGVGKTTAARVLAKALNCERGPAADPCNECASCRDITRGSDLDVIEVDAATYSKVEQVRELTESLKYGPAHDRYKVVVLDEVHRLSRQAFDALLKIVEEPPPFLVFIFATTEIDAVPATILSRCQEFHFRRVPSQALAAYLRTIAEAESITTSDTALRLIARAGEGSVRDSVALLDQLATFGSGTIADEDAIRLLGGLDTALFYGLLEAILRGDGPAVAGFVRRVEDEGWDPRNVYGQFLAFARDALHLGMGGDPDQVDLPAEEAQRLAETARAAGYENLLRLLHQLLTSEQLVRRSDTGALAVEIAWLRAAELPKLTRIEELLAGGVSLPSGPAEAPRPQPRPAPTPAPPPVQRAAPPTRPQPVPVPPPPAVERAPLAQALGEPEQIQAFLDEVSRRKQPLAALLSEADLDLQDGVLHIATAPEDGLLDARLQQPGNRQIVEEAVAAVWGAGSGWRLVRGSAKKAAPPAAAAAAPVPGAGIAENPQVQAVLDIFGGRVEKIEEHGRSREE